VERRREALMGDRNSKNSIWIGGKRHWWERDIVRRRGVVKEQRSIHGRGSE